jgi:hypothetical protein
VLWEELNITAEIVEQPSETLTDRCARLIPGYWGYESSLIIADAEPRGEGFTPLVDVETAQRFAVSLAKCVLTGNAQFGVVDSASPQGQELVALISEFRPLEPPLVMESELAEAEIEEKSMMALLFELHEQSVEDRARALLELASLDGQERTLDEGFITDKTLAFCPLTKRRLRKNKKNLVWTRKDSSILALFYMLNSWLPNAQT